jgi:tetratricopeptide (TPR) repeat protein
MIAATGITRIRHAGEFAPSAGVSRAGFTATTNRMTDPVPTPAERPIRPAETRLRAQLAADPAQHGAALLLGDLLLGDGRAEEAVALLWSHCEDRACGDLLREYLVGERRDDDARRLFAGRGSDASASGLVDKAVSSHLRGDLEGAVTCCRLAQSADPNYAPAWNHLGRALFNARRATAARAEFVHAVRSAPDYAEAWHNLAHVLRDAQEFEQAERAYGHALRLRPAYRSALLNLGIVLATLGRTTEAVERFRRLLAVDPGHVEGWFNLALCQHLLGEFEDARASYERAIALDPRAVHALLQYGRLLNELRDPEAALQQFRRALDANPRDPEPWAEIAIVHAQTGNLADAERAIAAGFAVAPGDPRLCLEQAHIEQRRGREDTALSILRSIEPETLAPPQRPRHQRLLDLALVRSGRQA